MSCHPERSEGSVYTHVYVFRSFATLRMTKSVTRRFVKKEASFCALLNVVFLITIQRYNILQAHCPPTSANVRQCPPTFVIVCKCGSCLLCLHFYQQSNVTTCLSALRTLITLSKFSKFFDSISTNIKFTIIYIIVKIFLQSKRRN